MTDQVIIEEGGITQPKWADAEHTIIDCVVKFSHLPEPVAFTASADDPEAYGRAIHAYLVAGSAGEIAAFDAPQGGG